MKKLVLAFALASAAVLASGCDAGDFNIPKHKDLKPGGVYISYVVGCKEGCDKLTKGDLIQRIDGKPVKTEADIEAANLTDGNPHKLELLADDSHEPKTVTLVATPQAMPPIENVPPFWYVGAERLDRAPDWARRRMFGHASPMVMLVNVDGGILDGRQLKGKKRLILYWDWGTRVEQAQAATMMKVLQKAQADLSAKGVDVMFVHLQFPTNQRQAAMNDSDLRKFMQQNAEVQADGTAYPALPAYRWPNATEFNAARQLGMENAFTVYENLGASPTLVLMDAGGIIRWHSESVQQPPEGSSIPDPTQYTVIEAIQFALNEL